ncbi:MAG TPA: AvrPphF family type III effector [Planctomycetota bacterium]|nr:AvrPphF family type III effector [Planctomycetota bacterium]
MFGFLKHIVHAVTHFVKKHVATIASFGASVLAFTAVVGLAAVCPLAIPALVTLGAAGVASGVAGYGVSSLFGGPFTLRGVLVTGALSGALTVATGGLLGLVSPAEGIDPVTAKLMADYGIDRETTLYRVAEPRWIDGEGTVAGNPSSVARVRDFYDPQKIDLGDGKMLIRGSSKEASTLGPSLNVGLGDPGAGYGNPGDVVFGIKWGDVLDRNGRIYPDIDSADRSIKPLLVTFDGRVPAEVVRTIPPDSPGFTDKLDEVSK